MPHKDPKARRAYQRKWRERNRALVMAQQKTFHERQPEAQARYAAVWRAKNVDRVKETGRAQQRRRRIRYGYEKHSLIQYRSNLKRKYGLSLIEYDAMLVAQGARCGVCAGDKPYGRGRRWHVDHNHATNKVRGLLCSRCNTALGLLRDDPSVVEAAAAYLRRHA